MAFWQLNQPDIDVPPDSVIINKLTEGTQRFLQMSWHDRIDMLIDGAINIGLRLIAAVIVFIIGRWLIKRVDKLIDRIFVRRNVDTSINTFVRNMFQIVGYVILILILISILGIRTTSIVAILASASFAIGMALSGTLQNFAGGIMILLLKPFRTGDYIQAQGMDGTVKEIKLFNTILITPDNKTIILPNGGLSTNIVNNYSRAGTRRIEWAFGISYGDDYTTAKNLLTQLLEHDERVMKKPPYFIALQALDDSAVSIVVRAWTSGSAYWDVFYDMNEKVYTLFPQHGLTIPFRKIDVNVTTCEESEPEPVKPPTKAAMKKALSKIGNETKSDDNSITSSDLNIISDSQSEVIEHVQEDGSTPN